jgi:hypothetical protein
MKTCLRSLLASAVLLPLVSCDKPEAPLAAGTGQIDPAVGQTQEELAAARDALQRQALEIETRTALMDKQLADMAQALKEQENAGLRRSLDDLERQNDELRSQAEEARRQSNDLAQKLTTVVPAMEMPVATAPADYSLFYDQLTPHGRWFDVSGYGYCWRPTITTARWRPYVDGCWSWSSLGWTWQSNEPFGWIVYHYGRWVNLAQYGWIWVPGSEWAPAWVAWRQSHDYVGWAPLPPDPGPCNGVYRDCDSQYNLGPASYVFITTNHFVQPSYTSVCAPVTQNSGIFQSSVNVTQIVRCDDRQRPHVFKHHGGPPRAQVEQACARPVQQVQVQTAAVDQIPQHRPGHHREPGRLQPVIVDFSSGRKQTQPVRPKITDRIERPKRVDAFEGLPQRVAHEIRETIAEEKPSARVQQLLRPSFTGRPQPSRMPDRPGTRPSPPSALETVRPAVAVETPPAPNATPAPDRDPQATPGRGFTGRMPERPSRRHDDERSSKQSPWKRPGDRAPEAPATVSAVHAAAPTAVPAVEAPAQTPEVVVMPPNPPVSVETTPPQPKGDETTTAGTAPEPERRPKGGRHGNEGERPSEDADKARMRPGQRLEQPGNDLAVRLRQQQEEQEAQQRAAAAQMAAEQAAAAAATDRARQQADAAAMQQKQQQDEQEAQQRAEAAKMAAEQVATAAEMERARQQADAAAMQQRQMEEQAAQQRAAAEKAAADEAKMAAQRAEAEQMQRQQEESARRAQEMAAQQAAEQIRREQEMAQRRAEQEARVQAEAEMRRTQEMAQKQAEEQARRAAEEQMRREQEMAQRQAEEQARRAAEEQMRREQEMAQRQAEEEARRQAEEQMRRAQEMAQLQAEEQARRAAEEQMRRAQEEAQRAAQEAAQRAAEEAARRAAEEAARNQPQPQNPGS